MMRQFGDVPCGRQHLRMHIGRIIRAESNILSKKINFRCLIMRKCAAGRPLDKGLPALVCARNFGFQAEAVDCFRIRVIATFFICFMPITPATRPITWKSVPIPGSTKQQNPMQ